MKKKYDTCLGRKQPKLWGNSGQEKQNSRRSQGDCLRKWHPPCLLALFLKLMAFGLWFRIHATLKWWDEWKLEERLLFAWSRFHPLAKYVALPPLGKGRCDDFGFPCEFFAASSFTLLHVPSVGCTGLCPRSLPFYAHLSTSPSSCGWFMKEL